MRSILRSKRRKSRCPRISADNKRRERRTCLADGPAAKRAARSRRTAQNVRNDRAPKRSHLTIRKWLVRMPDWRDYQEEAADFFRSLGLDADTDVTIQGVRTKHGVDVLVKSHHYGSMTWIWPHVRTSARSILHDRRPTIWPQAIRCT
jgi:hypothetical protein